MDFTIVKPDQTLDVKGMCCPMPLLKTKKAIEFGPDSGSSRHRPRIQK